MALGHNYYLKSFDAIIRKYSNDPFLNLPLDYCILELFLLLWRLL
jgi:hypothetical protein